MGDEGRSLVQLVAPEGRVLRSRADPEPFGTVVTDEPALGSCRERMPQGTRGVRSYPSPSPGTRLDASDGLTGHDDPHRPSLGGGVSG